MAGAESNPIQQRMELFVEKWEALAARSELSLVRIHAKENEKDMVSSFYTYLLGVDTGNNDIPVIFESIFRNDDQYSNALLTELEEMINTWNKADKSKVDVKVEKINWHPDYALFKPGNPAYLFIENINRFAIYLNLQDGIFLVPIFRVSFTEPQNFNRWLESALKLIIHPKVKLVIDDTESHPYFKDLIEKNPGRTATLIPELDMDNAMQQVAAMGNPNDPAVQYRKAFILLTQAIEKRKEKDAEKHGAACIEIAIKNMKINPYWIGQIIAVYAALANDQVGYKNYGKAIAYSTMGVKAAEKSRELIADEFIYRKFIAQAIMLRASLYTVSKEWAKAIEDFKIAADHYTFTNDIILAMEAHRIDGFCNNKYGDTNAACDSLAKAVRVSKQIPLHTVKFTTFPGIIELLLDINNSKHIKYDEIESAAKLVYGDEWMKEIENWKKPNYEKVTDPSKVIVS